jgi:hypothetical protein
VSRRGKQTDLRPALDAMMRRLDRGSGGAYTAARILSAWGRAADGVVSAHTTGAHVREGALVVYVDGNSWATHFSAMGEQYRVAVNEELGEELISTVRFVVSRKVADEHKIRSAEQETEDFYRADETASVSLTDIELDQVRSSVAEIPDAELREAVLRATVKDLEWKKGLAAQNGRETRREGF